MYRLTDAYENGTGAFPSVFVGVILSLLFTVGMAIVFNVQNNKMHHQLSETKGQLQELADKKDVEYDTLTVNGDSQFGGDINADSNLTVGGQVDITGDTTITGNLDVSAKAKIDTVLGVAGDTTLGDSLSVLGKTDLGGALDVAGAAILQSGLTVTGDTSFGGDMTLTGPANVAGAFDVAGNGMLRSALTVGGDTSFGGNIDVFGAANLLGAFDVVGTGLFQSSLAVGGDTSIDASASGANTGFLVQGTVALGGDLEVTGVTNLSQTLSAGTVDSTATFDGTVINNGVTTLLSGSNPSFTVQAAATLNGDMEVNGVTLLKTTLVQGSADPNTSSSATFDGTYTDNSSVAHLLTSNDAPTFSVQGASMLYGDLQVNGVTMLGAASTTSTLLTVGAAPVVLVDGNNQPILDGNGALQYTTFDHDVTFDGTYTDNSSVAHLLTTGNTATFTVQGATSLFADVTVNGVASLGGDLNICMAVGSDCSFDIGDTTLSGAMLAVAGATNVSNTSVTVTGATQLQAGFTVNNAIDSEASVDFDGSSMVDINNAPTGVALTVAGQTTITGQVSVEGSSMLQGLDVTGLATFESFQALKGTSTANLAGIIFADDHISSPFFAISDGDTLYHPGVSSECNTGEFPTRFKVEGGLVTGTGDCHSLSTRAVTPTGTETGACNEGNEHIRITGILNGMITDSVCAQNDGSTSGNSTNYDLAENFPSVQRLEAGDVVAIDASNAEYVVKTAGVHDDTAIGVVSTAPGITLGSAGPGYPIALAGRVPVKVTDEGGPIAAGDYLTSASLPGYAKKAAPGEKTIGQALESFTGTTGTVKMFVNVSTGGTQMQAVVQGAGALTQGSAANLASLNVSGPTTLSDLTVTGVAVVKDLEVIGQAKVVNISVAGHIIGNDDTRGNVTISQGQQTIHHTFTTPYEKAPTVVASPTNQAVLYMVTSTPTGFDISLASPTTSDVNFNYLAQE